MFKLLVVIILGYLIFNNFSDIQNYFSESDISIQSTTENLQELRKSADTKYQQLKQAGQEVQEAKQAIDNLLE